MSMERGDKIDKSDIINYITNEVFAKIYPIGAIYVSLNSTDPSTVFGGTWQQINGKFLIGADATYTAGATGGNASVAYTPSGSVGNHKLTTSEIPSHSHGLNSHTHSVGAHAHGLNGHTHTYTYPTGSTSQNNNATGSTRINFSNGFAAAYVGSGSGKGYIDVRQKSGTFNSTYGFTNDTNGYSTTSQHTSAIELGGYQDHTHTLNNHAHTVNTGSTNTGGNSGSTANSTAFNTGGASGNTASAGSDGNHNHGFTGTAATIATLPPYLAVYMWQRIA